MSRAGDYIDAFCPKCGLLLAHIIIYELYGKVSRVQCRTCKTEHKYRGGKPEIKKRTGVSRASSSSVAKTTSRQVNLMDLQRWQEKKTSLSAECDIQDYKSSGVFNKGDVIKHGLFGIGFVEKIIFDTQMEVLFEGGVKRLAIKIKKGE